MARKTDQRLTGLSVAISSLYLLISPLCAQDFSHEPIQPVPQMLAVNLGKVALNFPRFRDGRTEMLSEQVDGRVQAMRRRLPPDRKSLEIGPRYRHKLFSCADGTAISSGNIKHAIAEYGRTLLTANSRFDQYMNGDKAGYQ